MAATVIDELSVLLRLDSSQFTEQQRKAIESLDKLQQNVKRIATTTNDDFQGLGKALLAITNPLQAIRRALEDTAKGGDSVRRSTSAISRDQVHIGRELEAQSRRAGDAVRSGGMNAAEGFAAMARTALLAFTGIEAMTKAMQNFTQVNNQLAGAGRQSWAANMSPTRFGGLQNLFFEQGNVPKEQTANYLQQFEVMRQGFRNNGMASPFAQTLSQFATKMHMSTDELMNLPQEEILARVAAALQKDGPNGGLATWITTNLGMPAGFAPVLAQGRDAFNRNLISAQTRAPNGAETAAATRAQTAINTLSDEFDKLKYILATDAEPAVEAFAKSLTSILHVLEGHPTATNAAVLGGGAAIGYGIIRQILKFLGIATLPSIADGATSAASALGALLDVLVKFGPIGAFLATLLDPTPAGSGGEADDEHKMWLENLRRHPEILKGGGGAPPRTPLTDSGDVDDAFVKSEAEKYHLDPDSLLNLTNAESPSGTPYASPDQGGTSYGRLQMRSGGPGGGLADEYRKATGKDPSDPKNARDLFDFGVNWGVTNGWGPWSSIKNGKVGSPRSISPGVSSNGVNKSLDDATHYAASKLPAGYSARMISGVRNEPGSKHALGLAEDWQITGPNGDIPNRGDDSTGMYQKFAVLTAQYLLLHDPAAAQKFAWGGHFGTQLSGSGPNDLMHFDIGGNRGSRGDPHAELLAALAANRAGGDSTVNSHNKSVGNVNVNVSGRSDAMQIGGAVESAVKRALGVANVNYGTTG